MPLGEQHVSDQADPRFTVMDVAAFKAKNRSPAANYLVRHAFLFAQRSIGSAERVHLLTHHDAEAALPRKVSNDSLRHLDKNWRAVFAACEAYRENPGKFTGRPQLPKYQDTTKGRVLLLDDSQALARRALARGRRAPLVWLAKCRPRTNP